MRHRSHVTVRPARAPQYGQGTRLAALAALLDRARRSRSRGFRARGLQVLAHVFRVVFLRDSGSGLGLRDSAKARKGRRI
jgi:hypothetical protein